MTQMPRLADHTFCEAIVTMSKDLKKSMLVRSKQVEDQRQKSMNKNQKLKNGKVYLKTFMDGLIAVLSKQKSQEN